MGGNEFTRGPIKWFPDGECAIAWIVGPDGKRLAEPYTYREKAEVEANCDLIVAAFNAATALADAGYDAMDALEKLPQMVEALRELMPALQEIGYPFSPAMEANMERDPDGGPSREALRMHEATKVMLTAIPSRVEERGMSETKTEKDLRSKLAEAEVAEEGMAMLLAEASGKAIALEVENARMRQALAAIQDELESDCIANAYTIVKAARRGLGEIE